MKKFFISKNYRDRYTASSKAKLDCEKIVGCLGFHNIGLNPTSYQNEYLGRLRTVLSNVMAICRMPKQGVAFLQYPVFAYKWQMLFAKKRQNKVITIIHDLNILRDATADFSDKIYLAQSDVLIVHTSRMQEWCRNNLNCNQIIILELFDYINEKKTEQKERHIDKQNVTIAFAGNLGKSPFLDKLRATHIQFELFGIGVELRHLNESCVYKGCFPPEDLSMHINSQFGLVWDGDSIDKCSGKIGEYLKYIAPHKISMYLSCGIPVIVWKQSAMADFVMKNQIGIAVESLDLLESILNKYSEEDYQNLIQNVFEVKKKLLDGFFLKKAIEMAEGMYIWKKS